MTREPPCGRDEAATRLRAARSYLELAELAAADERADMLTAAAGNAILAGIAAADAICCDRLGRRRRGQRHVDATLLLTEATSDDNRLATDLRRLLSEKDTAHYGTHSMSRQRLTTLLRCARRLVDAAGDIVRPA